MAQAGETVLITGGAGFLGQHILRLVLEKCTGVKEIRTFDIRQPKSPWLQQCSPGVLLRHIRGDVTKLKEISRACRGVDVVFHAAAIIDISLKPDASKLTNINVIGTQNVVDACMENNVPILIHTSSLAVVVGNAPIVNGDETVKVKENLSAYAKSKYLSELIALEGNNKVLKNGGKFKTIVIRPTSMYGEEDGHTVIHGLIIARMFGVFLPKIGFGNPKHQETYVGNTAWMHIKAWQKLKKLRSTRNNVDEKISGRVYMATDDTPVQNFFDFIEPFIKARGWTTAFFTIPYWLAFLFIWMMEMFCYIVQPFKNINIRLSTHALVFFLIEQSFNCNLAKRNLDYQPLYGFQDSLQRSIKYYKDVDLDEYYDELSLFM
ncbi:3 beta-hydroxysteroid dehydrogenase type 7-like [Saccoglossus kowalevskii]|uniref:3 beta-hydroxysteroid dehydrogenase type 7-like n=1 Tax=Saccoglossus kowalevskii TaxID=10224 RepID=A0ABM0H051_SACKO|nr:PREDICTED: 3 beta-hydroxysteroid dehydrogenase type 7-like [Saccoglossus kowalevskii]